MTTPTSHAGYQIAGQTSHPSVAAASISPAAMGSYPAAPASHSFSEGYSNTNYSSPAQGHNHRGSHSSGYRGGRGRRGRATRGGRPDHATDAFGRSLREGDRRSASPPPRADAASQYRRGGAGAARSRSPPRGMSLESHLASGDPLVLSHHLSRPFLV